MAHRKLGNAEQAAQWMQKGTEWMDQYGDQSRDWITDVQFKILHKEAMELLEVRSVAPKTEQRISPR